MPFLQERFFLLSISNWSRAVLFSSFCLVFVACAGGKFGQQPAANLPEAVSAQPAETAPVVYYAGVDQLAVYSEPRSSSSLLTQLPLHQKVYRSTIEKGYAYIKVEGSGVTGWVDNARLIWRLPAQQQKASTKTEKQAAKPEQEAPVEKEKTSPPTTAVETPSEAEAADPKPTPIAAEAPAEQKPTTPATAPPSVSPAPSAPAAPSAPKPIEPSIFNPF